MNASNHLPPDYLISKQDKVLFHSEVHIRLSDKLNGMHA